LAYDANGNLLSKDSTQSLHSYDAENRLVEVTTSQPATVSVTLQPGWNFFSLPVIPDDLATSAIFPTFSADLEQFVRRNPDGTFAHFLGHAPKFNDFTELAYGVGYQLYVKAASPITATLTGQLPTQQVPQTLESGWHLLPAITTDGTLTVGEVFTGESRWTSCPTAL